MRHSRVLIQNDELRKLFWVGEEKDGSLYIGSYLSTNQYKTGSFVKPPKSEIHGSYSEGKTFNLNRHTKLKFSIHPSGELHAKTQDKQLEQIWKINREELYKINGCKQLGIFLPKEIKSYPIIKKTEKKHNVTNIVLPITIFNQKPFAINLHLAEKGFEPKQLAAPKTEKGILVVWENLLQFILLAYQTKEMRNEGVFPPKEYWIFLHRYSL